MANNSFLPTGFTATSTFTQLSSLLNDAGITFASFGAITGNAGYIKNNDTAIDLYIGQGTSAPSAWATIGPESAILFEKNLNTSLVWVKAASSTVSVDFVEGANAYQPPLVNGVIGTITATENVVPKADSNGNLVASNISDDGSTTTIADDLSVTGTIVSDDATTPGLTIESGNTNTGYVDVKGKTSGKLRVTVADAMAQTVTLTTANQTSGAGTLTIPDLAGTSVGLVTTTATQTLSGKTLTAPVINTGTVGTSLVATTDDGATLGDATHNFSDLFLASGALINYANGNSVVTHSSGILTVSTGDLRVTTAGTNTASVVTVGGTQTLTNKTVSGNIGAVLASYLASTVTYNNTDTLANTAVSVTVAASGIYAINLVVYSTSAVKALNMDFAGTATIANFVGQWESFIANGDSTNHQWKRQQITAIGTDFTNADVDGATSCWRFTGSIEITNAGTFLLRGAQNAADESDTTILRGSTLALTRIA